MGGNGTFTVEEAEIDARNTNVNNTPAIFDECVPVIADGYHLNYAKAVDSEGTEIDLLSSGTQDFAKYKNVHFITKVVYPVSFVVTPDGLTNVVVKVNGQEVTGSVSLEAGTYPVEVTADNCKAYTGNITITADVATHTQTVAMTYLPADYTKVDAAIAKANALEKDNYKDFSTVEEAINAVVRDKNITEQDEVDAMAQAIENAITALVEKPTEAPTATPTATPTAAPSASPTAAPTATPTVKPTATPSASPTAVPTATPTVKPTATPTPAPKADPNNPKTGSSNLPVVFGSAALVLSGGALAAVLIYKKKRHEK